MEYTQLKISVAPELASAFKAACLASGVSMTAVLSGFMAKYSHSGVGLRPPELATRRQRRAAVEKIARQLELIRDAEENYRDNIPENLQGSVAYENADQAVSAIDEIIENIGSVY